MTPINYLHVLGDRAGSERSNPWSLEEDSLPRHARTHAGRLPGSSLSHFMSTQLSQWVIQTLNRVVNVPCKCCWLAKFTVTCCSRPHCYQLRRGWTGSGRGQSQLWLVLLDCRADGSSLNRLLGLYICRNAYKLFRFSWTKISVVFCFVLFFFLIFLCFRYIFLYMSFSTHLCRDWEN